METRMIGAKISSARKKMNISQAQLAERMFISPQAVGKWERGESIPDIVTVNRLAQILSVDLNYFSESFISEAAGATRVESLIKQGPEPSSDVRLTPVGEPDMLKKERSWDMSRENLVDTDFSGLKNLHEKFSSTNMQRCLFKGSDMSGLVLNSNNVDGCDFSGSDISRSHIQNSYLANNKFKNCSLKETEILKTYVEGCDFSGAYFGGMEFKSGGFGNNTIVDAVWNRTSFIDAHLVDIIFEGTLEGCHFENCTFTRVTFQNSTLINTFFKNNRRLNKIKFIGCNVDKLTYALLKTGKADLGGITLA